MKECAVYHHHIRRQLIDYANAQGQFSKYVSLGQRVPS